MPCNPLFWEEVFVAVFERPLYILYAEPIRLAARWNFGKLLRVYRIGFAERFIDANELDNYLIKQHKKIFAASGRLNT